MCLRNRRVRRRRRRRNGRRGRRRAGWHGRAGRRGRNGRGRRAGSRKTIKPDENQRVTHAFEIIDLNHAPAGQHHLAPERLRAIVGPPLINQQVAVFVNAHPVIGSGQKFVGLVIKIKFAQPAHREIVGRQPVGRPTAPVEADAGILAHKSRWSGKGSVGVVGAYPGRFIGQLPGKARVRIAAGFIVFHAQAVRPAAYGAHRIKHAVGRRVPLINYQRVVQINADAVVAVGVKQVGGAG